MPTSSKAKLFIKENLPKDVPLSRIYELGSGWGNLVFMLADAYPNHQIIGFETSIIPYYFSKMILYFKKTSNLKIKRQDFYTANLSDGGLIVCYLFPKAMEKLGEKFDKELTPCAYVLSHTFALTGKQPKQTITIEDIYHTKIYLYKVGDPK